MIMVALMLPLMLALSGLAMGISQLLSMRSGVVSVTDASAFAAAETLSRTRDVDKARAAALTIGSSNEVLGHPLELNDSDVEFGTYVRLNSESRFEENTASPNAVRVTGRFDTQVAFLEVVPSMLKQSTNVEIVRSSTFAETDRDIALVVDRSSPMAYDLFGTWPPIVEGISPELVGELPPPPSAPNGWTWCLSVPNPSNFTQAIAGSTLFLGQLRITSPTELVTLVTFADNAAVDVPLSVNYPSILAALRDRALRFCGGSSDKGRAITLASDTLIEDGRPHAVKSLILITDNADASGQPQSAASYAQEAGVLVHTISLGSRADSPAAGLAAEIASAGGGFHQHARNLLELSAAMGSLAGDIPVTLVEEQ